MVERCKRCLMRPPDCLCGEITSRELSTRLALIMHHSEVGKPTNTGRLAALALKNSEVHIHGGGGALTPHAPVHLAPSGRFHSVVLFPSANATPLTQITDRPVRIVVPDGTWAQARRMVHRIPALQTLPGVQIATLRHSHYVLRRNQNEGRLCTLEAIAECFRILEGDDIADSLHALLHTMIERSLAHGRSSYRLEEFRRLVKLEDQRR